MDKGSDFITYAYAPSLKSAAMTRIVAKLWEVQCCQLTLNCKYNYDHEYSDKGIYDLCDFCFEFSFTDQCSGSHQDRYSNIHYHNHDYTSRYHDLPDLEKAVLNKLFALRLPKLLEREIRRYVMHIGQKLFSWIDPMFFRFGISEPPKHICWTTEGTVNISETMRLIYNHQVTDRRMFMAISNACLEDLIKESWEKMSRIEKDIGRTYKWCRKYNYGAHLVVYWLCYCNNDFSRFFNIIEMTDEYEIYEFDHSVFLNMFNLSVHIGNKLAARYFWQKLTEEEKNTNMMDWIDSLFESMDCDDNGDDDHEVYYGKRDGCLDILFFLLGHMNNSEQQRQVFRKYKEEMVKLLIFDWPWQKYLLQTISVMFPLMEEIDYVDFMGELILHVEKGRVIEKLFGDIWYASPMNFKTHFIEDMIDRSKDVFPALFDIHDLTNITLVLNLTTEAEKKDIIFSGIQSTSFISSAINNLDDTDGFLKETLPSESDVSECKTLIIKYLKNSRVRRLLQDHDRKATEDFLKWCLISEDEVHRFKNDIGLDTVGKIDI